jgi:hypothetical protein
MDIVAESIGVRPAAEASGVATLDDLASLDAAALERLYVGARTPALAEVTGDLRGRMLAVPGLPGWLSAGPRAWAGKASFPWRGKSFAAVDAGAASGEGINRVLHDRTRWFPFRTFIGPSKAGAFPALQLDYDRPGNPWFIRAVAIRDEVRAVGPGLFLGQAYFVRRGRAHLVLYFGLARVG